MMKYIFIGKVVKRKYMFVEISIFVSLILNFFSFLFVFLFLMVDFWNFFDFCMIWIMNIFILIMSRNGIVERI